ncbi:ROK family protein [Marinicrinis lubricantis]|uniref:ROK family protein n=1 Tax=Marinicrinis lubricantis TaxID=2086470 RepID=A0ABW1IHH3_9BACL
MKVYAGVDIGGTNMVCGLVSELGQVLAKVKVPTNAGEGSAAVLDRIVDMVRELEASYSGWDAGSPRIAGLGIGVPGLVDPGTGYSQYSSNLGWLDLAVRDVMEKKLHLPVVIDNDVRMYVYGEALYGAGIGSRHVLGVTIGTGIAAAYVQDGQLYYGAQHMAGEIGHFRMDGVNELCACGRIGCLETISSAGGMVRQARKALQQGEPSLLFERFNGSRLQELTAADLSNAYDRGDTLSIRVMEEAGAALGRALAYGVMMMNPDRIIIGGGGALAGERLLAPLRKELLASVLPQYAEQLEIVVAKWNDDAGIIGAAMRMKAYETSPSDYRRTGERR